MGVGGRWRVSMDELMDKNLRYFVGGNLPTLSSTRYDTRRRFNVRSKADTSQLNLPDGNEKKLENVKQKN